MQHLISQFISIIYRDIYSSVTHPSFGTARENAVTERSREQDFLLHANVIFYGSCDVRMWDGSVYVRSLNYKDFWITVETEHGRSPRSMGHILDITVEWCIPL